MDLFTLSAALTLNSAEFNSAIEAAEKKGDGFGKNFATLGKKAQDAVNFGLIANGVSTAVSAIGDLLTSTSAAGDAIDKNSQKLGLSREAYQEWGYILGQNGSSIDNMNAAMKNINAVLADTAAASDKTKDAYSQLGVSMDSLTGMSTEDAFGSLVTAFQNMEDGAAKSALAVEVFGKAGMDLMPLLNAEAGSVDDLRQAAHDLGFVMSDEGVTASAAFGDAMDNWNRTMGSLGMTLGTEMMPAITDFITSITPIAAEVIPGIANAFSGLISFAGSFVTSVAESMRSGSTEPIKKFFSDLFGEGSVPYTLISGIIDVGSKIFSTIQEALETGDVGAAIGTIFDGIFGNDGAAYTAITTIIEAGKNILSNIWSFLTGDSASSGGIETVFDGIFGAAGTLASGIASGIVTVGSNIIAAIYTGITGKETSAEDIKNWFTTNIVEPITEFFDGIVAAGTGIVEAIKNGIDEMDAAAKSIADWFNKNIATPIIEFIQPALDVVNGIVKALGDLLGFNGKTVDMYVATHYSTTDSGNKRAEEISNSLKDDPNNTDYAYVLNYMKEYGGEGRAVGIDYVPYNDYAARLHEGERVLTKAENVQYVRDMSSGSVAIDYERLASAVAGAIAGMSVKMDGQTVGDIVTETVSRNIARSASNLRYAR